ncbi:MAG: 23S rRNA (adenine(1618)-N(6))-methyltransferase RlmF [Opitutae bacterium]|nr:23S rRNA (adenine(1618)-N(6))-methyltransferase RlmF [Opitutae bacterium]
MRARSAAPLQTKDGLHPRNRHRAGYDFERLGRSLPALAAFVTRNPVGRATIDFTDPAAVKALNQALLRADYGIAQWDLPPGYLCPPIPGRVDYLHHLADLLSMGDDTAVPRGPSVAILDIGVGANCIYPLLGAQEYGWRFVGTELDPVALRHAQQIVATNPAVAGRIDCRPQTQAAAIFRGAIAPGESFAASICNPPFHASADEAAAGTRRKLRNLGKKNAAPVRNFGGQSNELWCDGGELAFIRRMIAESAQRPELCRWFTTLLAKSAHLPAVERALAQARVADVRIMPMAQGQKQSRIVAWTFFAKNGGAPVSGMVNATPRPSARSPHRGGVVSQSGRTRKAHAKNAG